MMHCCILVVEASPVRTLLSQTNQEVSDSFEDRCHVIETVFMFLIWSQMELTEK